MNIPFPKYVQEPEPTPRERAKPTAQELRKLKAKNTPIQKAAPALPLDPHWEKRLRLLKAGQVLAFILLMVTVLLTLGAIGSTLMGVLKKTELLYGLDLSCLCLLCAGGILHLTQKLLKRLDRLQGTL